MLWRLLSALAGAPLGWLVGAIWWTTPATGSLEAAAVAGAVALAAAVSGIERVRPDDPARGRHLAVGATAGFAAAPAALLAHWGLAPPPAYAAPAVFVLLLASLALAVRATGPCSWLRWVGRAVAVLATATFVLAVVSASIAAWGATDLEASERRATAIYDLDAQVESVRLPDCRQRVTETRVLANAGAHPVIGSEAHRVWFDATVDGLRQVHLLRLDSGTITCWTCGQPGNNRRPAVGPQGGMLVYESDRHTSAAAPDEVEIYQTSARGEESPGYGRRLTYSAGPDERPVVGPSSTVIVWSRREAGRYAVVAATLTRGHGGVVLREPGVLVPGGAAWTAALGWSRDARSLVTLRGNPLRPLDAVATDPATGEQRVLWSEVGSEGGVGFNGDGGWAAIAGTQRRSAAGLLPDSLGFALGRFARAEDGGIFRGTRLATGNAAGPLYEVELAETAAWGAPTGVAMTPDGARVVLGQRRPAGAGIAGDGGAPEERLVELSLSCQDD